MNTLIDNLENIIDENRIILSGLRELDQNMEDYLDNKSVLCYKNCKNMEIKIESTINKIILKNCSDITFIIMGLITGVEIEKCNNIKISCKNKTIGSIIINRSSSIIIKFSKKFMKNTYYDINNSNNINIKDLRGKNFIYK